MDSPKSRVSQLVAPQPFNFVPPQRRSMFLGGGPERCGPSRWRGRQSVANWSGIFSQVGKSPPLEPKDGVGSVCSCLPKVGKVAKVAKASAKATRGYGQIVARTGADGKRGATGQNGVKGASTGQRESERQEQKGIMSSERATP